jgi:transcriptional regulator with XRE-family HTH domain
MDPFAEWLLSELDRRNMSQSDLARAADLAPGTVSNIINGRRGRSDRSLSAIAKALKIPTEIIFRKSGILPASKMDNKDPDIDLIMSHVKDLDQHDRDAVLEFIHMLDRLRPKRKK